MPFLIKRREPLGNGHSAYVGPSGGDKSYVTKDKALKFNTERQALAHGKCGNESIVYEED